MKCSHGSRRKTTKTMKTKSFIQSLCLSRLLAGALALFITLTTASAVQAIPTGTLRTYIATWSGANTGSAGSATGTFVLDDTYLQNGFNSGSGPGTWLNSFTITVTGASSGNGTFPLGDYDVFARVSGSNYHSSNWLQSCGVKGLKSCFASSSWRGIFSNGWTLRSCKVLCKVPGSASCLWRMATIR